MPAHGHETLGWAAAARNPRTEPRLCAGLAYVSAGVCRLREVFVLHRQLVELGDYRFACWRCFARCRVDVQQHELGRRHDSIIVGAVSDTEVVQPLRVVVQQLHGGV